MSLLVQDIVKMGERQLSEAGIFDAKIEAEILYCFLKKIDRSKFFLRWARPVDERETDQYFSLISTRASRIPLQHIMGEVEFMGLPFKVAQNVLIPRMDTEVVVLEAEKMIKPKASVLDLCSGSGIIGISLAKRNQIKLTSSDFSDDAVKLTRENMELNGVKADVVQGDLFEPVKRKKFNMIVSNPPYIRSDVIPTLEIEVRDHDPILALDGGEDGLEFYKRIISGAKEHLKKGGALVFEIGNDQGEAVADLMEAEGVFTDIEVIKDLADQNRVIKGRLGGK
ncbi:MAG: peptide chain release factor N(5)-glutamine methyltransferase [Anaerovoracaceae bacterium]